MTGTCFRSLECQYRSTGFKDATWSKELPWQWICKEMERWKDGRRKREERGRGKERTEEREINTRWDEKRMDNKRVWIWNCCVFILAADSTVVVIIPPIQFPSLPLPSFLSLSSPLLCFFRNLFLTLFSTSVAHLSSLFSTSLVLTSIAEATLKKALLTQSVYRRQIQTYKNGYLSKAIPNDGFVWICRLQSFGRNCFVLNFDDVFRSSVFASR